MYSDIISYIRSVFDSEEFIPLHEPFFGGNEKKYVLDAIDSTYVSSVGAYVNKFEEMMAQITGAKYAVATTNGTAALHLALIVSGVKPGDEVITQPVSFVATANAITYTGATPVFIDVDLDSMGMSPAALHSFLKENVEFKQGVPHNKLTGNRIATCIPMHTYGFPCRIDEIALICKEHNIPLIEDAAESIGSYYKTKHTGTFGTIGTFSFNGNKTITCGGGGALVTDDENIAKHAKHISTTAKIPHQWEFVHDEVGYNYRMPNLNAALACAQLEQLNDRLENKRELADIYKNYFLHTDIGFITEIENASANYWLNSVVFNNMDERNKFLETTNQNNIMTRPMWLLLNKLPMYAHCLCGPLGNAEWLEQRIVNIPSSYRNTKNEQIKVSLANEATRK